MKTVKTYLEEAKKFNQKKFESIVGDGLKDLWKAYNKLEIAGNYLRSSGQNDAYIEWMKKIRVIESTINKVDRST